MLGSAGSDNLFDAVACFKKRSPINQGVRRLPRKYVYAPRVDDCLMRDSTNNRLMARSRFAADSIPPISRINPRSENRSWNRRVCRARNVFWRILFAVPEELLAYLHILAANWRQLLLRTLVVDDEANIRVTLGICLEASGHEVVSCASAQEALTAVARQSYDLIFLDVRLGVSNRGLDLIPMMLAESPWAKDRGHHGDTRRQRQPSSCDGSWGGGLSSASLLHAGSGVQLVTRKMLEQRKLEMKLSEMQTGTSPPAVSLEPITTSSEMRQALDLARRLATGDTTLLIRGESGVGKEWLGRLIHSWSGRAAGICATVGCQATSPDALDEELFGLSTRDAAESGIPGRAVAGLCDRGTLILKEIGAAPLTLQPRLLRLIREKEYERHNESGVRKSDVRVVATTSEDLEEAAARNRLRSDLLFAVNIVQIELPPLRQRREDIRFLAERFVRSLARARANRASVSGNCGYRDRSGWPPHHGRVIFANCEM